MSRNHDVSSLVASHAPRLRRRLEVEAAREQTYPVCLTSRECLGLVDALERVAAMQPEALQIVEKNGFVFDDIGREPGNWQHLAFSLYTTLCEAENLARNALVDAEATE